MNFKNNLVLCFLLALSGTISSKNIYLKYDPACMDRYEYRFNNNIEGNGLISYYLKGDAGERIMMEIGVESIKQVKKAPKGMKTCGKIKVDDLLANSINSGKDKVYIVRSVESYYFISLVHLATFMADDSRGFEMVGSGYRFSYYDNQSNILKNIAKEGSSAQIFFTGTDYRDCLKNFMIKKIPEETCKPYTDFSFIPGIGIIEEKTGLTPQEAEQNKLQLVRINNLSLSEYLDEKCNKNIVEPSLKEEVQPETYIVEATEHITPTSYEVLFPISNEPIAPEHTPISNEVVFSYEQPVESFQPKTNCKELSYKGVHIVQTNETLYGISRKYGITVQQIRNWNGLKENTVIKPCASLYVLPPTSVAPNNEDFTARGTAKILYRNTETETTKEAAKESSTAEVLYPKSGVPSPATDVTSQPTPTSSTQEEQNNYTIPNSQINPSYTNSQSNNATPESGYYWTNGKDYHIVQKGETLTSLAKMYGFTLERFRHLNNLGSSDLIKVGQLLKTGSCLCPVDSPYNPAVVETSSSSSPPPSAPIDKMVSKGNVETQPAPVPVPYEAESTIIKMDTQPKVSTRNGRKVHTVKENETLASIATMYNIPIETLRKLNNMEKNEVVIPFQKIYLE